MKIISYNTNGIRAAIKKGFDLWAIDQKPDILCIQETKASEDQVDLSVFENAGYNAYWHSAQKKGYSGTLTLTKIKPQMVQLGIGIEKYDNEGRVIITTFEKFVLFNCYFPSGTSGEERQAVKYDFLEDIYTYLKDFNKSALPSIVLGDYNIAHTPMDIHDPKGNKKSSGFLPEERAWLDKWFTEGGMVDSFRFLNPDKVEYSWWSARFNSRANNKGWRIDNISVSKELVPFLKSAGHYNDAVHSDHCGVFLNIF